jgi:hypothetical protein
MYAVWETLIFLVNGLVFILMGLLPHSAVGVRSETRLAGRSDEDEMEPCSSAGES